MRDSPRIALAAARVNASFVIRERTRELSYIGRLICTARGTGEDVSKLQGSREIYDPPKYITCVPVYIYVSRTRLRHREGLSIPLREGNIYGPGCKSRRQLAFTVTALRDMHSRG